MSNLPIVAVGQMTSTSNHDDNFRQCKELAIQAKRGGACVLFLQCFNFVGGSPEETISQAEKLSGDMMSKYITLARENTLWLSLGGFHEKSSVETIDSKGKTIHKVYNSHIILDSKGTIVSTYHKVHLFDVDVPGGLTFRESSYTVGGSCASVAVKTPAGILGLATCYDLRFPEHFTRLVSDHNCTMICCPSAFTVPTGTAHWHVLLRARAIETQSYMLAASQVGRHNMNRRSYGHAIAIDAECEGYSDDSDFRDISSPSLIFATIDKDKVNSIRSKMPIAQHRRVAEQILTVSSKQTKQNI